MKRDNAFTGLEAAIVLIAFVVVAAIFSYVMLGAGFFATQKAQEVTYAGVKQSTSNLIPDGTLYGNMTGDKLERIQLSLSVPLGGHSQEFKDLMVTYTKQGKTPINIDYDASKTTWNDNPVHDKFSIASCTEGVPNNGTLVGSGDSCSIVIKVTDGSISGEWFQIEIKPPVGAPTTIRKTIPTGYMGGKLL